MTATVAKIGKRPYTFKELLKLLQNNMMKVRFALSSVASGFLCPNGYFITKMTDEEAIVTKRLCDELCSKELEEYEKRSLDVLSLFDGPLGPAVWSYFLFDPPDDYRYRFAREVPCVELRAGNYSIIVQARYYFTLKKRHPNATVHMPGRNNYQNYPLLFLEDGVAVAMLMSIHLENYPFPEWRKSDLLFTYNHKR